jgi:hypothetical protein
MRLAVLCSAESSPPAGLALRLFERRFSNEATQRGNVRSWLAYWDAASGQLREVVRIVEVPLNQSSETVPLASIRRIVLKLECCYERFAKTEIRTVRRDTGILRIH